MRRPPAPGEGVAGAAGGAARAGGGTDGLGQDPLRLFLAAIDQLVKEGLAGPLPDETRIVLRVAAQGSVE